MEVLHFLCVESIRLVPSCPRPHEVSQATLRKSPNYLDGGPVLRTCAIDVAALVYSLHLWRRRRGTHAGIVLAMAKGENRRVHLF